MATPEEMRERYRKVAYRYRNKPGQYGLRPHTVAIVVTSWAGAQTGEAAKTPVTTPIVERDGLPPKIRWLKQDELALQNLPKGSVEIGPITPDFSIGGTSIATLTASSVASRATFHFLITGPQHPSGAKYKLERTSADHALHYTITASPVA